MALASCDTRTNRQGRELAEHGAALFPAACCDDDLAKGAVPYAAWGKGGSECQFHSVVFHPRLVGGNPEQR